VTRFAGKVGYGLLEEVEPGVHEDVITEISYVGDVVSESRQQSDGTNVHPNISVNNSISIVADAQAERHFLDIRYVEWAGRRWTVTDVKVQRPRLILRLGEVYHGPTG
jgi:hypothetical protein